MGVNLWQAWCLLMSMAMGAVEGKAEAPKIETLDRGVVLVRDDNGSWDGDWSLSVTHQNRSPYQAKKVVDLSGVPEKVWQSVRSLRLSVFFCVRDYSSPANGLDEAFEVVVNGSVHRYPTRCGAPVFPQPDWFDFALPREEFRQGLNEVLIRKAPSEKNDDYLYLGIDRSVRRGRSFVTFDGREWHHDRLTVPGGVGEFMVRLYLLTEEMGVRIVWEPGTGSLHDPGGIVAYCGSRYGRRLPQGLSLPPGESARMEWHPAALDTLEPIEVSIDAEGPWRCTWLDERGEPMKAMEVAGGPLTVKGGMGFRIGGIVVKAGEEAVLLRKVEVKASLSYRPLPRPIDMAPPVRRARPPERRPPQCRIAQGEVLLEGQGLRCRFEAKEHLRLLSLFNRWTGCEMVRSPEAVALFLVEVEGSRYAGSADFRCRSLRRMGRSGFLAELALPDSPLLALLSVAMEEEGLRMGLKVVNGGQEPFSFKVAFPHLAGLTVSGRPQEDYYFFPWGGGIIADVPALIRRGYGDHEALYQVMDLFHPASGGGLYLRMDDPEGWHKILALRKGLPDRPAFMADGSRVRTRDEFKWIPCSLGEVEGIGLAVEYLQRTRGPGEAFSPPSVILAAHGGDWHEAMERYSAWAHRVWKFRPFPSRLQSVHTMIPVGWDGDTLFRDGQYRTDFIKPNTDCVELMSWWEWSPLGPWRTPIEKVREVLGEATYNRWKPYFVQDPVTGQLMWNNQPGDYKGYNERFGGLPAFRQAIQTYKRMGVLVTLYTDPFRLDDHCETGQKYGRLWGVIGADGKYTNAYDVWNPCHDVAEVRQWVAETMRRVMMETGADGIRLDEYGHMGWACFSDLHRHTFQEPGVSQWMKATAEATKMVRAAMDEVAPGSVLTTEHPGYDYLLQFIEGCITYDLTVQATPLRPLECNLQRFYFPECKAYELDHRGVDPDCKKRFWNAVACFGRYWPQALETLLRENEDVYSSRDCYPLLWTPGNRPHVYINRFRGGGKVFYHIYNATGHTVEGTVVSVDFEEGHHILEMLRCEEPLSKPRRGGRLRDVHLYLPKEGIACVAVLRRRLTVRRQGDALLVSVSPFVLGGRLVVADAEGCPLLEETARREGNRFDLAALGAKVKPRCVKLLHRGLLVDMAPLPPEGQNPQLLGSASRSLVTLPKGEVHRQSRRMPSTSGRA